MSRLRIGIVGCGYVAGTHAAAYQTLADVEIAAVCDVLPDAAERLAAKLGCAVAPSLGWMASEGRLDAVSICTSPVSHSAVCEPFLRAGIPVLCEKPLAATVEDAEYLADLVRRTGTPFMVGFCHRFQPAVVKLKAMIDRGDLGRPLFFRNTFSGKLDVGRSHRGIRSASGGGALLDNGAHSIDLVRHLVGEPTEAQAMLATYTPGVEVEELASLNLRVGPAVAHIVSGYMSGNCGNVVEWVGDLGGAVINYFNPALPDLTWRKNGESQWQTVDCSDLPGRFPAEMAHFVHCVRTGTEPAITAEDGLRVNRIADAAYASAGNTIPIAPSRPSVAVAQRV